MNGESYYVDDKGNVRDMNNNFVWATPKSIVFSFEQMEWLLKNLEELLVGRWPPKPPGVAIAQGPSTHRAYFEVPCQMAAEVESRIDNAGVDGRLCVNYYTKDDSIKYLAKCFRCSMQDIDERIESAMRYVSGWRRKRIGYQEWRAKIWRKQRIECKSE